jgi:translocation and assembly module TamB
LRAGIGTATLEMAGTVSPSLNMTARLRNVTPALAKPFAPDLQADGVLNADAALTGSTAAPMGLVHLAAANLHMRDGAARGLPPASLDAQIRLHGTGASLDARLAAGPATRLRIDGEVPMATTGSADLHAAGALNLALLDPVLMAQGRRVQGDLAVNLGVAGSLATPRLSGQVRLSGGDVQDFTQGVHIGDLAANIVAEGGQVRLASLQGRAGPGTISAAGTIGLLAPEIPLDLTLTARNARPLASDRLTADLDADLRVEGAVRHGLSAAGQVVVHRASVTVPDHLPASVAVLTLRNQGAPPPPPAAPGPAVALALQVKAPGSAIFVRGHGLDAVLGGGLRVDGSAAAPKVSGGFDLLHGTFSLAGTTLTFSRGRVSFAGTGATGKIDPSLDFEADSKAGGVTAKLLVGGYASAPKISLASEPAMPQDEVLAHLLFGTGTQSLGPFQIASIAEALASITGIGGSAASDPLNRIRGGLGLDRLSVGTDSGNSIANSIPDLNQKRSAGQTNETTVQAGRYVANGVYVGAKQGTSGTDTQAEVQIDITKRLKAETDLGSGRGGSNVGVTYQFEY